MTLINEILNFLLGQKYWAVITYRYGGDYGLCETIHRTQASANAKKIQLLGNRSFRYITTVSFRSRHTFDLSEAEYMGDVTPQSINL